MFDSSKMEVTAKDARIRENELIINDDENFSLQSC